MCDEGSSRTSHHLSCCLETENTHIRDLERRRPSPCEQSVGWVLRSPEVSGPAPAPEPGSGSSLTACPSIIPFTHGFHCCHSYFSKFLCKDFCYLLNFIGKKNKCKETGRVTSTSSLSWNKTLKPGVRLWSRSGVVSDLRDSDPTLDERQAPWSLHRHLCEGRTWTCVLSTTLQPCSYLRAAVFILLFTGPHKKAVKKVKLQYLEVVINRAGLSFFFAFKHYLQSLG